MTEPYIPFYKPYGMSDAEYAHEIDIAHQQHEEWALHQQQEENEALVLSNVMERFRNLPLDQQQAKITDDLKDIADWYGGFDELLNAVKELKDGADEDAFERKYAP